MPRQRTLGVHDLVGEAGEVGQRGVVHDDDPQPGPPGRVQHRFRPGVGARARGAQGARVQDDGVGGLQLRAAARGRAPGRRSGRASALSTAWKAAGP